MKLTKETLKRIIKEEMEATLSEMEDVTNNNLTFDKIANIHRFVEKATFDGRHWMFPQGVSHDIYTTLNNLFASRINVRDLDDTSAMQEYISIVEQIPGADLSSIQ